MVLHIQPPVHMGAAHSVNEHPQRISKAYTFQYSAVSCFTLYLYCKLICHSAALSALAIRDLTKCQSTNQRDGYGIKARHQNAHFSSPTVVTDMWLSWQCPPGRPRYLRGNVSGRLSVISIVQAFTPNLQSSVLAGRAGIDFLGSVTVLEVRPGEKSASPIV